MKKAILFLFALIIITIASAQEADNLSVFAGKAVVTAQYKLAIRYLEQNDTTQVIHWVKRAVENGYGEARNRYSHRYGFGKSKLLAATHRRARR